MPIVRAKVMTNSSDDEQRRVRIFSPHVYEPQSDLIEVVGRQPLNIDDMVLVDITNVFNPLVIGKCFTANTQLEGHNLFRISVDDNWTEASVSASKLAIKNNKNSEVVIEGDTVTVKAANVNIQGTGDSGKAKITLNGGDNGQVMNVSDIVNAINNLQTDVTNLRNSCMQKYTATIQDGGVALWEAFGVAVSANPLKSSQIAVNNVSDANFKH